MLILAFLILIIAPGSMVKTERTDKSDPSIIYTNPSSQTVGSLMVPETSITSQFAIGSSCVPPSSSVSVQAVKYNPANNRINNFFIFKFLIDFLGTKLGAVGKEGNPYK